MKLPSKIVTIIAGTIGIAATSAALAVPASAGVTAAAQSMQSSGTGGTASSAEATVYSAVQQGDHSTHRQHSAPSTFPYWSCSAPGVWASQCRVAGGWNQHSAK